MEERENDSFYIPMRELLGRRLKPVGKRANPLKDPPKDFKIF